MTIKWWSARSHRAVCSVGQHRPDVWRGVDTCPTAGRPLCEAGKL